MMLNLLPSAGFKTENCCPKIGQEADEKFPLETW
jgi:hypothetical protein